MKVELIEETRPYEFKWWDGTTEKYDACYHYKVTDPPPGLRSGEMFLAIGQRAAYGADRRRVLVFRNRMNVLAEFVGTDDWADTRYVAWPLKAPGGNRGVPTDADVPREFRPFTLSRCSDWITGPSARRGIAVRAREDDHTTIIHVALIREQHKQQRDRTPEEVPPDDMAEPDLEETVRPPAPSLVPRETVLHIASYSREYVEEHLFATIARVTRHTIDSGAQAYDALVHPMASLSMLLGYYAFARQGAERAGYNEACIRVLAPYVDAAPRRFWDDFPDWQRFHAAFVKQCEERGIRQNEKVNPGLIRDIYARVTAEPTRGLFHAWAERIRTNGRVVGVFEDLVGVHGIGDKIASFICRDTVFLADLESSLSRDQHHYLQPVDIWIGRIAEFLNGDLTFGKDSNAVIASYLADVCAQHGVSNASFNQGGWYFGSQVAGSATRLVDLLTSGGRRTGRKTGDHLVIVACGKRKIWDDEPNHGECPAKDAYRGQFFTVNRRYAEWFAPRDWMILSARYGFLLPDTPIRNYSTTFKTPSPDNISVEQLRPMAVQMGISAYREVEVLGGSAYVDIVRAALEGHSVTVVAPYTGCRGIGHMMGRATAAIQAGVPMDRLPAGHGEIEAGDESE